MRTNGTWTRRGATIVVDLGSPAALRDSLESELESGQPTLRQGSQGSAVSTLQTRLAALRFSPGPIDGKFGTLTGAAVRAFQTSRRLQVDGIVGPQTWAALGTQGPPAPSKPPKRPLPTYGNRREVHVLVPFHGWQENIECFDRCKNMATEVNVQVGGPDLRIQVATSEDAIGRVTIDPAKAREGLAYIDSRLDAGDPVVVGVSYMDAATQSVLGRDYNVDFITDHFVIITQRGTDPVKGLFYGFHDPATAREYLGSDQNLHNRFYLTPEGGLLRPKFESELAPLWNYTYGVSMVRRNL